MKNTQFRNQRVISLLKKIVILFLLFISSMAVDVQPAFAHTPHDDIIDIGISPHYDQDSTVFAISRETLLKSTDRGLTWQRIVKGLDNKYRLYSLDISSQNKQILLSSTLGDGIYKSQDGGLSWFKVNNGLRTLKINQVSFSPYSSNLIFATGSELGLYKTTNGGETWYSVADPGMKVTAIAFSPSQFTSVMIGDNKGNLYISDTNSETWRKIFSFKDSGAIRVMAISPSFTSDHTFFIGTEKGGLFQTIDGGKTFSKANVGLTDQSITSIILSPTYGLDSTVWVSTWKDGVFRSQNGGNKWEKASVGLTKSPQADKVGYKRPHFSNLKISGTFSQDKTLFLAGFNGLFQSINGGQVWREIETLSSTIIVGLSISPNYQIDSTLAVTTYINGAHLSKNQGVTWQAINNGLEEKQSLDSNTTDRIARLFNIAFSPNYRLDNTIFSTSWSHFLKSESRGNQWKKIPLFRHPWWNFSRDADHKNSLLRQFIIAISSNYLRDSTVYLGTRQGEVFRSIDGGNKFTAIGRVPYGIRSLSISPYSSQHQILFAGTEDSIYKTIDGGKTWALSKQKIKKTTNLAISPNYPVDGTVFAGTQEGLFVTRNQGKSWVNLTDKTYGLNSFIEAVTLSPNFKEDQTLLVSVKGKGLFKSIDRGESFTAIAEDLINNNHLLANFNNPTAIPIQFSPSYRADHTIYGFSGTEVFKSTDKGETWKNVTPPKTISRSSMASSILYLTSRISIRKLLVALITVLSYLYFSNFYKGKLLWLRKLNIKLGISLILFTATLLVFTVL